MTTFLCEPARPYALRYRLAGCDVVHVFDVGLELFTMNIEGYFCEILADSDEWIATVREFPGIAARARSRTAAGVLMREQIVAKLKALELIGHEIPEPLP